MNRELIVVLGMHRSGTSAVTRGLKVLGVELGEDLMGPGADNPRGFWEKKEIIRLNILVLEALGIKWDSLSLVPPSRWEGSLVKELQPVAARIIRKNLDRYPRWGFKDPRTLRVLPFWIGAFELSGISPRYLLVVRNPVSVARSLQARDRIPPARAYLLWAVHVIPYLARLRNRRLAVVDYDLLMDNPLPQLNRIAAQLAIPAGDGMAAEMKDYGEFLSQGLRHSRHTEEDLMGDPAAGDLIKTAYLRLHRLARDEAGPSSKIFWREWSQMAEELDSLCASRAGTGEDTGRPQGEDRAQGPGPSRLMRNPFNKTVARVPANAKWMVIQRKVRR